jgi:hypothetical protein
MNLRLLDLENVDGLKIERILPGHVSIRELAVRAVDFEDFFFHGMPEHGQPEDKPGFLVGNPDAPEIDAVDVVEGPRVDLLRAGLRCATTGTASRAGACRGCSALPAGLVSVFPPHAIVGKWGNAPIVFCERVPPSFIMTMAPSCSEIGSGT